MEKEYLSADELLLDSCKLAENIYQSGYKPDLIVGVWRGGAPVGIAVQEYLEYRGISADHIAIRTSSYKGINQQEQAVSVQGLNDLVKNIHSETNLLLVDDVFDSGRSMAAIISELKQLAQKNTPRHLKVATPWFKPKNNVTDFEPDFYLHITDKWLVFPHELMGLTETEIKSGKPDIADILFTGLKAT